nr:hypothetical protein [Tanacetum cinerariifolium]
MAIVCARSPRSESEVGLTIILILDLQNQNKSYVRILMKIELINNEVPGRPKTMPTFNPPCSDWKKIIRQKRAKKSLETEKKCVMLKLQK